MFGSVIYDQSEVEERIRQAQRAILNPKKQPKDFLDNEDEDELDSELNFSTNCVSLQISGPEVADLSFCDLPGMSYTYILLFSYCSINSSGLIASVSSARGSSNDIALVESLVTAYIKKPSCIILLTVALFSSISSTALSVQKNVSLGFLNLKSGPFRLIPIIWPTTGTSFWPITRAADRNMNGVIFWILSNRTTPMILGTKNRLAPQLLCR